MAGDPSPAVIDAALLARAARATVDEADAGGSPGGGARTPIGNRALDAIRAVLAGDHAEASRILDARDEPPREARIACRPEDGCER